MHEDPQGLAFSAATDEGAALFTQGLGELLRFKPSVFDTLGAAIAASPGCPLPSVAKAYLHCFMTEPGAAAEGRAVLEALHRHGHPAEWSERERGHLAAAEAWAGGDMHRAAAILDTVLLDEPRDVLALRIGHELDFFVGDTPNLRDRVARALGAWREDDPHYGFVLACMSFGLEENGHYARAEECGRRAVELHADDVWGVHAVAHTYEMQARIADAVGFLRAAEAGWGTDNLFTVHNWWHYAIFHLDAGDDATVLDVYDRLLFHDATPRLALVLLDGTSLLWRLFLAGADTGRRFAAIADAWHEVLALEPYYVFNDMHASLAYVGAGRLADAEAVVTRIERYLAAAPHPGRWDPILKQVGLPICRALAAFGRGRFGETVELLYPVRSRTHEIGGSHAQRDAIERTLFEAALRAGQTALARALASERTTLRPASPQAWQTAARAAQAAGDTASTHAARRWAEKLRANVLSAIQANTGLPRDVGDEP